MADLRTYWHTVRHLKPVQIYGRLWFHAVKPRVDLRPAPAVRAGRSGPWVTPVERRVSMLAADRFQFLGETHDLGTSGWDDPGIERLWRYNLHYFDDLNAVHSAERAHWHDALLARWVRENPPPHGTAWEPYPVSLRIVNWIKWALGGNVLSSEVLHSLAVQVRWLSRRLETHLLGNHLLTNAKALVFAGLFYEGPEADAWLRTGLKILRREIPAQILPDGGQFELSPMYHALALEDMLDLANVLTTFADAIPGSWRDETRAWNEQTRRMRRWLSTMCHPDAAISFFNDAAIGIAPSRDMLDGYATRLGFPDDPHVPASLTHLRESGYVRVDGDDAVTILDVGEIGPAYLPAHAHADTLSFELSLYGHRVFVNSGTSRYGGGPERQRQRGTAAHNTVEIDGLDSSEVWGGFRVARRAHPRQLAVQQRDGIVVSCSHDGYRRLPGKPLHRREWRFRGQILEVADEIIGQCTQASARLYIHPSVKIREDGIASSHPSSIDLELPGGERVRVIVDGGALRYEPSTWHPEFGESIPNHCLVTEFEGTRVRTRIAWGHGA